MSFLNQGSTENIKGVSFPQQEEVKGILVDDINSISNPSMVEGRGVPCVFL